MMIAQADRHKVTDQAIPAGTAALSCPLSILLAETKSTTPQYEGQNRPISGPVARYAGFWSPDSEPLQRTTDRSANARAPSSVWGISVI